jgi:hypothetical protein
VIEAVFAVWFSLGGLMSCFLRLALLALMASSLLGGCATLTTSSSQTVTLTTEPPGAACTFKREGEVIGIINPTPGSLTVSKSHSDIDVTCTREGYLDAVGRVGSKFQAMTFGNILFGGIIGIAVDAVSGATAEYEANVAIRMTPAEFASAEARDKFFEQQRETFVVQANQVRERISSMCKLPDCEQQLRLAAEEEKAGLARIEAQRQASVVKPE